MNDSNQALMFLVLLVAYLVNAVVYYKIAQKAKLKNSWFAFVPFLQFILFFHIINRSAWWVLILFIPIVGWIAALVFYWEFYSAFGISTL